MAIGNGFMKDAEGQVRDPWLEVDEIIGLLTEIRDAKDDRQTPERWVRSMPLGVSTAGSIIYPEVPAGILWEVHAVALTGAAGDKVRVYVNEAAPSSLAAKAVLDGDGELVVDFTIALPVTARQKLVITTNGANGVTAVLWARVTVIDTAKAIRSVETGES